LRKFIADDLVCREGIDNAMQDEFTGAFGDEPVLSRIFSMIFTTLVCVIALNALIQYMGESVAAVRKEKHAELIRQRAGLLVELITLGTGWCSCKGRLAENEKAHAWVHCLVPTKKRQHWEQSNERFYYSDMATGQWVQWSRPHGDDRGVETPKHCDWEPWESKLRVGHMVEDKSAKRCDLVTRSPSSEGVQRMEMEEAKLNAIQHEFVNQEERLTKLMDEKLSKSEGKIEALLSSSQEKIDGKLNSLLLSSQSQMLPQDVRHLLGSIQENHETGRVKEAQASFRTLVEW